MESNNENGSEDHLQKPKNKSYQWCFVPQCTSTSIKNPDKVFFSMPKDPSIKKKWFSAARRDGKPTKSNYYCCQDHFNLKEDMENFVRFQLYGGKRTLILKQGVVPHIFKCQPSRTSMQSVDHNRKGYQKLNRQKNVQEILLQTTLQDFPPTNTSSLDVPIANENSVMEQSEGYQQVEMECNDQHHHNVTVNQEYVSPPCSITGPAWETRVRGFGEGSLTMERIQQGTYKKMDSSSVHNNTQIAQRTKPYHYRSKKIMCQPSTSDKQIQTEVIQPKIPAKTADKACSPVHFSLSDNKSVDQSSKDSSLVVRSDGSKSYVPSTSCTSSPEKCPSQREKDSMKFAALNMTRYLLSKNPRKYLGIPEECMPWLMNLLKRHSSFSEVNIQLALMKMRMDDGYERLADQFGISTSQASRIFHKVVPTLSYLVRTFIRQPPKHEVQMNLPIPFRANYSNVYALIDAFEIQIRKPTNPVHQSLTWSDYKGCNTWKWIILCTPDGKTIFISKAYGGRISDMLLFEDCGVMDILPEGCTVMADRGFKSIEGVLQRKNIKLVRPPSVFEATQPTKEEVLETRRIAALRIHVERLIRRLREFKILEPHSCLDLNIAPLIDDIVHLVCGLINLQSPLIRT
ncbi:hypothetical protein QAD02_019542 [Eretmocerus hayati]|uniref:Uncharacterized protein n=2 Tax=Eretmocerus hayati TaxID=131215 RepID=A0ACC2NUU4_9HYME|nr:hypothetical protein QAD02_010688 [Eretmocerus hayati]KAJ8683750.1 hypothetical protein QAD02_019542 [Eretmocerus hayati]